VSKTQVTVLPGIAKQVKKRKRPPEVGRPFVSLRAWLLLFAGCGPFCRFQRVDPDIIGLNVDFLVGGEITQAAGPFCRRARISGADITNAAFNNPVTALTLFNNHLAAAAFSGATGFFPETTFGTGKYGLTLHIYYSS
jgi:hypothetical protein